MLAIAEQDDRIVGITAAMAGPTGLIPMQERFPDRVFDVGIAEQHAVTGAAGMAMAGLRPVVAVYSTFLSRAWDQVVYDVALHRLPVVFCLDRAGITGPDGASHHGVYDLALLSKVPGMRVLAPSNADELEQMLTDAVALADDGPIVIRYPRGGAPRAADGVGSGLSARKVVTPNDQASVVICAIGRMVATAETVAGKLAADGIHCTVWDVRSCVPLDPKMLDDAAQHQLVVTIEDGIVEGGIGSMLTRSLHERLSATTIALPQFINLGLPTVFIPHGAPDDLFEKFNLDASNVAARIRSALG